MFPRRRWFMTVSLEVNRVDVVYDSRELRVRPCLPRLEPSKALARPTRPKRRKALAARYTCSANRAVTLLEEMPPPNSAYHRVLARVFTFSVVSHDPFSVRSFWVVARVATKWFTYRNWSRKAVTGIAR